MAIVRVERAAIESVRPIDLAAFWPPASTFPVKPLTFWLDKGEGTAEQIYFAGVSKGDVVYSAHKDEVIAGFLRGVRVDQMFGGPKAVPHELRLPDCAATLARCAYGVLLQIALDPSAVEVVLLKFLRVEETRLVFQETGWRVIYGAII